MREYELAVVFDLSVAEAGGNDAAPTILTQFVEARGGKVLRHDHWGRRRLAYPINHALDADYVVSRVEIEPAQITPLEDALKIDERVYRHLIVRADELPPPPPPREPREMRPERAPAPAAEVEAAPVAAPVAEPEAAPEAEPATAEAPAEAPPEEPAEPPVAAAEPAVEAEMAPVAAAEEPAAEAEETAPVTEAPSSDVESPATEAEAAAEAGTDDEAPSA